MSASRLAGRRIVVTRPLPQAAGLADAIRGEGGEPIVLPAIEIQDVADASPFRAIASRLEEFDWAIFVSPTAVRRALGLLRDARGSAAWPTRVRIAAIGHGSQRALEEAGFTSVLVPSGAADSEALLDLPDFSAPAGRRIVIFRGVGGREFLGDTLRARGASVEYAECYVRARSVPGSASFGGGRIDAITVSSGEGLGNLVHMLDVEGRARLRETPLFVSHPRVAEQAKVLGVRTVIVAGPADAEMLAALVAYFDHARS